MKKQTKKMKTLLSLLICTTVFIAALPISGAITAKAETTTLNGATLTYTVTDGEATITDCDNTISGDVVLPNTLGGYPVTKIGVDCFQFCENITEIYLPDSITVIEESAFYYCTKLVGINIPQSVTNIGLFAFGYCEALEYVYITDLTAWCNILFGSQGSTSPQSNPLNNSIAGLYVNGILLTDLTVSNDVTEIKQDAFYGYVKLESVTIPDSVKRISCSAFENCTNLTDITIGSGCSELYSNAFNGCFNIENITVSPNNKQLCVKDNCLIKDDTLVFGTNNSVIPIGVKTISEYAFWGRSKLENINIPNTVTDIGGYAFSDCISLKSIAIPDSVTWIGGWAFSNCTSLAEITIANDATEYTAGVFSNTAYYNNDSNWENDVLYIGTHLLSAKKTISGKYEIKSGTVKICGSAFSMCSDLESVTIPNSLKYIEDSAFYNCTGLKAVYISDIKSWCNIKFADSYSSYYAPSRDSNPVYYAKKLYLNNELIINLVIPEDVTEFSQIAFIDCEFIEKISLPDNIKISEGAFLNTAFYKNTENWENGVLYIGNHLIKAENTLSGHYNIKEGTNTIAEHAFYECNNLESIAFPENLKFIGNQAFSFCKNLSEVTISKNLTEIGDSAFYYCENLSNFDLGNSRILSIGNSAFEFTAINKIVIPETLAHIGDNAFYNNYSKEVYISSIKQWCNIDFGENIDLLSGTADKLYLNNELITDLIIPDGITKIPYGAFSGQTSIQSISLPESITYIGNVAFFCTNIKSITIPPNVTYIGYAAFGKCKKLAEIIIPDNVTNIGYSAFSDCESLSDVYYLGTEKEWSCISIENGNEPLTTAIIHYNYVPSAYTSGDLDGNGEVSANDLIVMRKMILMGEATINADMNDDGVLNIKDLIALKKLLS